MILIDTVYIHQSGGKTLLNYFLVNLEAHEIEYALLLDSRIDASFIDTLKNAKFISIIKPSEYERLRFYKKYNLCFTSIFCFANVPPPLIIENIDVYIYFHNVLLLSSLFEKNGYNLFKNLKFIFKRIYILKKNSSNYNWVVQTNYIKLLLRRKLFLRDKKILVVPFFKINKVVPIKRIEFKHRFIYVADGVNQKNHNRLLSAFEIMHENGFNPSLALTVPINFKTLQNRIHQLKAKGLNIENYGTLESDELEALYTNSQFLIFPSLKESFGLPLLEATAYGCKVIASNLPYVNEIICPSDVFDPIDISSIYNSLLRNFDNINTKETTIKVKNQIADLIKILINNEKLNK